jgi:hypothetical protein
MHLVVGCCLLAVGCWLLSVACWLLPVVCYILIFGYWLLVFACWLLAVRYFMQTVELLPVVTFWLLAFAYYLLLLLGGCWLLTVGYWLLADDCGLLMLANGCGLFTVGYFMQAVGCWMLIVVCYQPCVLMWDKAICQVFQQQKPIFIYYIKLDSITVSFHFFLQILILFAFSLLPSINSNENYTTYKVPCSIKE